jgi:cytochrome d ubiquinol oxidase subunit II
MVGIALVPGYVMLGTTYVVLKTTGPVQERAFVQARMAALAVLGFMAVVTVWTPLHYPLVMSHWFGTPRVYFVWAFPLFGLLSFFQLNRSLKARRETAPLAWSVCLFLSGYFGLATSLYPYAIPPTVTLWEAASQEETLSFMLWGAGIVLPVVLAYLVYSYAVFRGKVGEEAYGH